MTPLRSSLVTAALTGLALVGTGAVAAGSASATVGGHFHQDHAQVVEIRAALEKVDITCGVSQVSTPPWLGTAACGKGNNDARKALEQADARGCGVDVHWTDNGPLSYDGDYRYVVACP